MVFRDRLTLPLLILLTLFAGVLRFVSLDRPSLWGDEAATYGRVAGTYQEMLNQLTDSSFPPLHYELEWWIGQGMPYWGRFEPPKDANAPRTFVPTKFLVPGGIPLDAFALRFVPAAAGTLFVPAVFFVAVQLFGRRVALRAAALACFSAYLLVYSRDAKMYMHFWLATTLHVGFALWWVRSRRLLPWTLWVLAGIVAVGLHGSGFVILLVDVLIVILSPKPANKLSLTGVLTWPLTVGPAYVRERLTRRNGEPSWRWQRHLTWPRRAWWRFAWPTSLGLLLGVGIMLSAAFGPLGYYSAFSEKIQRVTAADRDKIDLGDMGINWVARYNDGRQLPDYLLYTASAYLTGWEWPRPFDQPYVNVRTLRLLQGATIALLALLAVGVVPWRKLFRPAKARLDRMAFERRVWPAFRSRRAWWVAVWLLAVPWVTYTQSTDRPATILDGVADVLLKSPPDITWPRLWVSGDREADTLVRWRVALDSVADRWPAAWRAYAAAWTRANVSTPAVVVLAVMALAAFVVIVWKRRAVGRGTLRILAIAAVVLLAGTVVGVMPRRLTDDAWMPRYLGTILPAFLILVAVLIDRQPRAVRWATMALFVVVNLSQFSARVWAGSEPPTGLMAADVVAAQPKEIVAANPEKPAFKCYIDFGRYFMPEPGGGTLFTSVGRMYLRELSGVPGELRQIRFGGFEDNLRLTKFVVPSRVERDVIDSPWVDRFVVWTALPIGELDQTDEIADRLKGKYRRVAEEVWQVRDHWLWLERWQVRRRTYERAR